MGLNVNIWLEISSKRRFFMEKKMFDDFAKEVQEMPKAPPAHQNDLDYGEAYGNMIKSSLANGTSPFLPNEQGLVDLKGTYNMRTNDLHRGLTQIMLLERQAQLGSPSGAFVTSDTVRKAQENGANCSIKKGEAGFAIEVQNPDKKSDIRTMEWFNISQINNPESLQQFLNQQMNTRTQETNEYNKNNKPTYYEKKSPAQKVMDRPNQKTMRINFSTPEEYIGQVLAAISTGTKLVVTPQQAENFKNATIETLNREHKEGSIDKYAIFKMASKANNICKNTVRMLKENERKQRQKEKEDPVLTR